MKRFYAQFKLYSKQTAHFQIPCQTLNRSYGAAVDITAPDLGEYVVDKLDDLPKVHSFVSDKQYIPCVIETNNNQALVYLPDGKSFQIENVDIFDQVNQDPKMVFASTFIPDSLQKLIKEVASTEEDADQKEAPIEEIIVQSKEETLEEASPQQKLLFENIHIQEDESTIYVTLEKYQIEIKETEIIIKAK